MPMQRADAGAMLAAAHSHVMEVTRGLQMGLDIDTTNIHATLACYYATLAMYSRLDELVTRLDSLATRYAL